MKVKVTAVLYYEIPDDLEERKKVYGVEMTPEQCIHFDEKYNGIALFGDLPYHSLVFELIEK